MRQSTNAIWALPFVNIFRTDLLVAGFSLAAVVFVAADQVNEGLFLFDASVNCIAFLPFFVSQYLSSSSSISGFSPSRQQQRLWLQDDKETETWQYKNVN